MLLLNETEIIEKSLNVCVNMKFDEFIKFNNIDIDTIKVDKFFHNLDNNIPIYMDENMISYFGYSGAISVQRKRIKELFETNFLEHQNQLWYTYNNEDYKIYLENLEGDHSNSKNSEKKLDIQTLYPPVPTGRGTSTTKHTLVMPKLFKEALMICQTEKGKLVRKFYIEMLDVFNLYVQFQNKMKINTLEGKLDVMVLKLDESNKIAFDRNKKLDESNKKLDESNKKLDESNKISFERNIKLDESNIKLDESNKKLDSSEKKRDESEKKRAESEKKRDESEKKRDESEKKAEIERQKADSDRKKADKRFQRLLGLAENTEETLKEVSKHHVEIGKLDYNKHPKFIIMKDPNDDEIPYYAIRRQKESLQDAIDEITEKFPDLKIWIRIPQPNAVAFFNLIKKELGSYMNRDGNWFGLKDITSGEFKKKVKDLNQRRSNPRKKK
jgi:hypothetical protein